MTRQRRKNKKSIGSKQNKIQESKLVNSTEEKRSNIQNQEEKKDFPLQKFNIIMTLIFSFLLVVIGFVQYITYIRQANIAENANKLAKYQYRFQYYEKLQDLQKDVSIPKENPQLEIEEFADLNYKILSLKRESPLLFDENVANNIDTILEEHLNFLIELNNNGMNFDDYQKEILKLNMDYGNFLNSNDFKAYLDINKIE